MNADEYSKLCCSTSSEWFCSTCLLGELPFANYPNDTLPCLFEDDRSAENTFQSIPVVDESLCSSYSTSESTTFPPNTCIFAHLNAQSLIPKWEEIATFLSTAASPLILGISETWLDSSVHDDLVSFSTHVTYRNDRKDGRGGGVIVYIPVSMEKI